MAFLAHISLSYIPTFIFMWYQEPRLYRCGFDFVLPWHGTNVHIPKWFDHQFVGNSVIRIKHSDKMPLDWMGFVFCVEFEVTDSLGCSQHDQLLSF